MAAIQVGDVGTELVVSVVDEDGVAIDVSTAAAKRILLYRPGDSAVLTKTASFDTDGTNGVVKYTTVAGDLTVAGTWGIQAYVEVGIAKWYTARNSFYVADNLPPTGWLDLEAFKSRLGITGTASDAMLAGVLKGVESSVKRFLGSGPILTETVTGYYAGHWTPELVLRGRPVSPTDLQVWESTATPAVFDATTILTADTDYRLRLDRDGLSYCGILDRLGGRVWQGRQHRHVGRLANEYGPSQNGGIKIVASVGFGATPADLPADLVEAGYLEAAARTKVTRTGAAGVIDSASLNGVSYSLGQIQTGTFGQRVPVLLSPAATAMLWGYRDAAGAVGGGLS